MSVIKSVALWCDDAECSDADAFNESQGGAFETATEVRREAALYGWTRCRGKDFCPEHSKEGGDRG